MALGLFETLAFVATIISASADNRPNILLLFPDEWRFDWADQYYIKNLSIKTPTFNSIVANGTRFVNALVGSPLCAPSRSCIASGKEYGYTGVPSNGYDFPTNETTFYKLMQNNGYWTMVAGKDDLTKASGVGVHGAYRHDELGFDDFRRCDGKNVLMNYPKVADPFTQYLSENYNMNNGQNESEYEISSDCFNNCCNDHACPIPMNVQTPAYQDNWITDGALDMLQNKPPNQPWFMQINWVAPHPPFYVLETMNETVNNRSLPLPMNSTEDPNDMMVTRRDYTAEIENLDAAFGKVIDQVRELGEYNNTIICVSSDHGEMLGDFNAWAKEKPWVASSNVPFVCMGPGVPKGNIIETYVTNMDMAGTFLDYTETEPLDDMMTRSLRGFLNGSWTDDNNGYREYVSSGLDINTSPNQNQHEAWRLVVQDVNETTTWKFICCQENCNGREFQPDSTGLIQLLFNVKDDLYEEKNVASMYPDVVSDMKELLPSGFCVPQR